MNDTNPIQEQNSTPPPITKKSVSGDKSPPTQKEPPLEKHLDEQAIDLNELFPDAETDLNSLFPDDEVKHLLKNITKNKKDMGLIKKRLATENEIPKENEEKKITAASSEPDMTEETETG